MTHQKDPLLQLLNSSGFPFQLRLEKEVEGTRTHHGWSVIAREHHWSHPLTGVDGYIDLFIGYGIVRLVIECKKAAESSWVFLVPESQSMEVSRVCSLCTDLVEGGDNVFLWSDLAVQPPSVESAFCLVRGQNEKDQPMIERYADTLLTSIESLAHEELSLEARHISGRRIYVPVLVTAADLQICRFDPASVDIESGRLPSAEFQPVPFVRFRKGLARNSLAPQTAQNVVEANKEKERTVVVLQASKLADFLKSWSVQPMFGQWPHLAAQAKMTRSAV